MGARVIGLDIGSTAVKGVLFDGQVRRYELAPSGWQPATVAAAVRTALQPAAAGEGGVRVVATGYGRAAVNGAALTLTEITCHARGAVYLDPEVRTVLDIGGQDCKAIAIDGDGAVLDFLMNDRCAAGTGSFLQGVCARLGVDIGDIDALAGSAPPVALNSTCAVFAESEMIGLLATGATRGAVAAGALRAVAERAAGLVGRLRHRAPIMLTGGLAGSRALRERLGVLTGEEYRCAADAHFCGAIGAALLGLERDPAAVPQ